MTSVTFFDHLFVVLVLGLVFPFVGWWAYRRFLERLKRDGGAALVREYKVTIIWLLGLGLATGLVWWAQGRAGAALGLRPDDMAGPATGILAGASVALLARPLLALASPKIAASFRKQFGPLEAFLPRTGEQLAWGLLVSLAAGVFEELAYRGYLIAYFRDLAGNDWLAIAASSVLFGCAHFYQGRMGTILTTILGAALGWIYVDSGSLVMPMLLHALIDISAMLTAYIVLRGPDTTVAT